MLPRGALCALVSCNDSLGRGVTLCHLATAVRLSSHESSETDAPSLWRDDVCVDNPESVALPLKDCVLLRIATS